MRFFFFSSRRRHTRLQGDWSSDVCSSDLGEHAAGECGILLVQEQLEGLLAADEISGAQLPGERRAVVLYLGFTHVLLGRQRRAARAALGSLAAHFAERFAELPDRQLRGAQLLREPVALDLL